MSIGLHVKYRLFLSGFNEILTSLIDFPKIYSNIKFHEDSSCGNQVVPRGQTDTTKLTVIFAILCMCLKTNILRHILKEKV
jgi:hypothetical protein